MTKEYSLKHGCSKIWAIHYSERRKKNYYFNRITRESYWDRPEHVTDEDIIAVEVGLRIIFINHNFYF